MNFCNVNFPCVNLTVVVGSPFGPRSTSGTTLPEATSSWRPRKASPRHERGSDVFVYFQHSEVIIFYKSCRMILCIWLYNTWTLSSSGAVFQSTRWIGYLGEENLKSRLQTWLTASQMYVYEFVGCLGLMSKLYHKLCFAIQYFFHFNRWTVVATQSKKKSLSLMWSWKNTKMKWRKWEMDLRRYSIYIYIYIYIIKFAHKL